MNRLRSPTLATLLAALLAALLVACCPAPLAATDPPEGVLVGVVMAAAEGEGGDGARPGVTWVAGDDGARVAVRPPLEQPPGTVVYLRGRWRDGAFDATEASTVRGGS